MSDVIHGRNCADSNRLIRFFKQLTNFTGYHKWCMHAQLITWIWRGMPALGSGVRGGGLLTVKLCYILLTTQAYVSVSLGINRLLFAPTSLLSAFCSLQFGPSSCCKHNQEPAICCSAPAVTNIGIHRNLWVSCSYICSSCYNLALHALQENFHCMLHSII